MLNKDGLEPGQLVDFTTLRKIEADRKSPDPLTRESIEAMGKEDIAELLEAHGLKADRRRKEEELRADLFAVMFVEA